MTAEEKAKAYDEALERAKIWQEHLYEVDDKDYADELNYIFPELAESEDEKIRKRLIFDFQFLGKTKWGGLEVKDILAWLENIPYTIDKEKREGFHLGYKAGLEKQGTSYTKRDVDDAFVEGMAFAKDELEKQGKQILANSEKTCKDEKKHALDIEIPFGAKDSELQEATYLIPEGFHAEIKDNEVLIKKGKQKPAWTEEDERMYGIVFEEYKNRQYYSHPILEDYDISGQILGWFKSLKDRVIPQQKSTWSEEDEVRLQACIDTLQAKSIMGKVDTIQTNWLRSLKQRYTWKPSKEQMDAMQMAVSYFDDSWVSKEQKLLESLYKDLKKL